MASYPVRIDEKTYNKGLDLKEIIERKEEDDLSIFTASDNSWFSMLVNEGLKALKAKKKIN